MDATYDKEINVAYIELQTGRKRAISKTIEVSGYLVNIDLDKNDQLIGIEFLEANKQIPRKELREYFQEI